MMAAKRIATPEEARIWLALPSEDGEPSPLENQAGAFARAVAELDRVIATEPDRIKAARVESYNQGFVEGYEKAAEGEADRTRAAVVKALRDEARRLKSPLCDAGSIVAERANAVENGADL
jgi:hypothetical protein